MLAQVVERVEARLRATNQSASAASAKAGLSKDAIRNMQRAARNGDRQGVSTATITALAPILETSVGWLLDGAGEAARRGIPVVGYVGGLYSSLPTTTFWLIHVASAAFGLVAFVIFKIAVGHRMQTTVEDEAEALG